MTYLGALPARDYTPPLEPEAPSNFFIRMKTSGVNTFPGADQAYLAAVKEGFVTWTPEGYETFQYYWRNIQDVRAQAAAGDKEAATFYDWLLAANLVYQEQANNRSPLQSGPWWANPPNGSNVADPVAAEIRRKLDTVILKSGASLTSPMAGPTVLSPASANNKIPVAWVVSDTTDAATHVRTLVYDDPNSGRRITITGYVQNDGSIATPVVVPRPTRKVGQLMLSKVGSPGDGIHFAGVAWRVLTEDDRHQLLDATPWVRGDFMVNRLSSETTSSVFFEDVADEVTRALKIGDQRSATYYDWPQLQSTVAIPGPGRKPPADVGIDTLAAPTSTSFTPVTLPPGTAQTKPPTILPPVPSGTEPPPDAVEPEVKPWTDVAVPPPAVIPPAPATTLPTSEPPGPMITPRVEDDRPAIVIDEQTGEVVGTVEPPVATAGAGSGSMLAALGLGGLLLFATTRKKGRRR